ncbi:hypothetical protein CEUSTIGMA_g3447.t1 [Chlamydomonas eustigma]|uniref:Helicase C-terminal domain-containing protein n=1 Tax=Chlamydomonas eustigma TaxID=1157962 RepID=A0A250WYT0_9CHLO|nr:hypothetical protein CEUSTIGMA_g3447.t1 [Chlamydomonas eustigma]|eukprot:GAX76004.1 hypothetical protein CEUSTIGMA_g3447.t1 [Chlamydomonas eustigma]
MPLMCCVIKFFTGAHLLLKAYRPGASTHSIDSRLHPPNSELSLAPGPLPAAITLCGKLDLLDRLLMRLHLGGHKVLIFCTMTRMLDVIEEVLDWRGFPHLRLDGATAAAERGNLVAEFNRPGSDSFAFLLSLRAGGVGLNLQAADTVIFYDSDWNPAMEDQAQARAHRIGQLRQVMVLRLLTAGTIEEHIHRVSDEKRKFADSSITGGFFDGHTSAEDRRKYLLSILTQAAGSSALGVHEDGSSVLPPSVQQLHDAGVLERTITSDKDLDDIMMSRSKQAHIKEGKQTHQMTVVNDVLLQGAVSDQDEPSVQKAEHDSGSSFGLQDAVDCAVKEVAVDATGVVSHSVPAGHTPKGSQVPPSGVQTAIMVRRFNTSNGCRCLPRADCRSLIEEAAEANRIKDPDEGRVFGKGMRAKGLMVKQSPVHVQQSTAAPSSNVFAEAADMVNTTKAEKGSNSPGPTVTNGPNLPPYDASELKINSAAVPPSQSLSGCQVCTQGDDRAVLVSYTNPCNGVNKEQKHRIGLTGSTESGDRAALKSTGSILTGSTELGDRAALKSTGSILTGSTESGDRAALKSTGSILTGSTESGDRAALKSTGSIFRNLGLDACPHHFGGPVLQEKGPIGQYSADIIAHQDVISVTLMPDSMPSDVHMTDTMPSDVRMTDSMPSDARMPDSVPSDVCMTDSMPSDARMPDSVPSDVHMHALLVLGEGIPLRPPSTNPKPSTLQSDFVRASCVTTSTTNPIRSPADVNALCLDSSLQKSDNVNQQHESEVAGVLLGNLTDFLKKTKRKTKALMIPLHNTENNDEVHMHQKPNKRYPHRLLDNSKPCLNLEGDQLSAISMFHSRGREILACINQHKQERPQMLSQPQDNLPDSQQPTNGAQQCKDCLTSDNENQTSSTKKPESCLTSLTAKQPDFKERCLDYLKQKCNFCGDLEGWTVVAKEGKTRGWNLRFTHSDYPGKWRSFPDVARALGLK